MATGSAAVEGGSEVTVSVSDMRRAFTAGEHVCWLVRSRAEYTAGERDLLARAAHTGDSVMIVSDRVRTRHHGSRAAGDLEVRVGRDNSAAFEVMHEQARSASRAGRGLRILAQMEHLASPDARLEDLIACEMDVAELAGHGSTSVVCAYRRSAWKQELLTGVSSVHSRLLGPDANTAAFRIVRTGPDAWALHGAVSYEAAASFAATVGALLTRAPHLRLDCADLELIDAASWHALISAATAAPGAVVTLERVNTTVATTWRLSGYEDETIPVRVHS